jgi:sec-independent protein translocase protein TatA
VGSGIVSPWHIVILLCVALLLFGPKRLPELGRSLGKGMREFRDSIAGRGEEPAAELLPASTEKAAGFCASCGMAMSEDARFCPACGAPASSLAHRSRATLPS